MLYDQTPKGSGDIAEVYSNQKFTYSTQETLDGAPANLGADERGDAVALPLDVVPAGLFLGGKEDELVAIVDAWSAMMVWGLEHLADHTHLSLGL